MLGMVEYETFTVLLLITFLSSWSGGKQVSRRERNFCPMLVEMDWE